MRVLSSSTADGGKKYGCNEGGEVEKNMRNAVSAKVWEESGQT